MVYKAYNASQVSVNYLYKIYKLYTLAWVKHNYVDAHAK